MVVSVAEAVTNSTKMLLANGVRTFFIAVKLAVINGQRKLRNPPFLLMILLVVSFKKIPLFSKDLITFVISFISLFVKRYSSTMMKIL